MASSLETRSSKMDRKTVDTRPLVRWVHVSAAFGKKKKKWNDKSLTIGFKCQRCEKLSRLLSELRCNSQHLWCYVGALVSMAWLTWGPRCHWCTSIKVEALEFWRNMLLSGRRNICLLYALAWFLSFIFSKYNKAGQQTHCK